MGGHPEKFRSFLNVVFRMGMERIEQIQQIGCQQQKSTVVVLTPFRGDWYTINLGMELAPQLNGDLHPHGMDYLSWG